MVFKRSPSQSNLINYHLYGVMWHSLCRTLGLNKLTLSRYRNLTVPKVNPGTFIVLFSLVTTLTLKNSTTTHTHTHTHTHIYIYIYIYTYAHILVEAHKYRLLHTRIFVSIQHSKLRGRDRTGSHRTYIFFNVDSGHYQGRCPPDLLYLSCLQCIKSSFNLAGYKGIIYPSWRIDVGYMEMHVF